MVEFGILGSLRVATDGRPMDVGGGRQRGLLATLLIDANRVVPLDRLIDDLLLDGTRAATATVRTYVSRLRRVIGTDRLLTQSPGYLLVVNTGELDAERFESLIEQAHDPALAPSEAVEVFDSANRLWRGPALAEFADLEWARPVAERLNRLRLDAAADRLDALLACGRPQKVAGEAEALVERHPLDERLWGLLIVGHYQSGRQADALRTYQRARTKLVEELGTEPGPALRALEQAVLRQDAGIQPHPAGSSSSSAPRWSVPGQLRDGRYRSGPAGAAAPDGAYEIPCDLSSVPRSAGPFVGRDLALNTLSERTTAAADRKGWIVLVGGEGGAGKTRLLAALAERAAEQSCLVLYGRCDEDTLVPYQAFVDALAPALQHAVPRGLVDPGPLAADLAVLFPDVHDGDPQLLAGLDVETRRHRLFEAIDRCLGQLARERTIVLLLDDVHFADRAVLRLLHRVVRTSSTCRLAIVCTFRPDEARVGSDLWTTLVDWRRHIPVLDLALPPLTEENVAQLLEGSLHDGDDVTRARAGLARRIHQETAGNALFVTELIRDLVARGITSDDELPLPATVADVIEYRASRLPSATQRLLTAAAVVGTSFELVVATDVAGLDDDDAVDAIDDAIARGLVVEASATPDRFAFSHGIVRRVLYQRLAAPRRARLHLAAAHALKRRYGTLGGSVETMAHHLAAAAAGGVGRVAAAVRYCRLAGDRAVLKLSYETAIEHYRRAVALLGPAAPATEPLRRCELLLLLGEALNQGGDVEEAKDHLLEAAEVATSLRRPDLIARAALAFGGVMPAGIGLRDRRGVTLLHHAVVTCPPDDTRARALLLGRLAQAEYLMSRRAHRLHRADEAVALARALDDRRVLATVLVNRYWALDGPDDVDAPLRSATEVEQIATDLGDLELALHGGKCRLHTLVTIDAWPEVLALADDQRRRAQELRQPEYERLAQMLDAILAGNAGRFDDAEELALSARELLGARRGQWGHASVVYTLQLQSWRWLQSQLGDGRQLERLERLLRSEPDQPRWHAMAAWTLAESGEPARAATHLGAVDLPRYLQGDRASDFWLVMVSTVLAAIRLGDRNHAPLLYEHLLPYRDRNAFVGQAAFLGCIEHHLGLLAQVLDRPEADDHLHRALARYQAMHATAYAKHVQERLTSRRTGDPSPRRSCRPTRRPTDATCVGG